MKRVLLLVTLLLYKILLSQDFSNNFRQISNEQGLPGQNVKYIYQDHNGIIWISIEAIGLCRYDGHKFELFNHSSESVNSLSSNYINAIIEDSNSSLWIATDKGLNKYFRAENSFKCYYADSAYTSGLQNDLIHTLYTDKNGVLWVGTDNGLYKYNTSTDYFECAAFGAERQNIAVLDVYIHSNGLMYLSTNRGLIEYNVEEDLILHRFVLENRPIHQTIMCVTEDKNGILWLGTNNGIARFDVYDQRFELWDFQPEDRADFENEGFNTIYNQDGRYLWFASYTNGFVIIDTETGQYQRIFVEEQVEGSIKSNHIRHIFKDHSGLLWISTKFDGIFIYDSRKEMFNNIPERYRLFKDLRNLHVLSFYNDTLDKSYWIGSKYNGLYKVVPSLDLLINYKHEIHQKVSIVNNRIHGIYRDKKKNLWIGSHGGLDRLDETNGTFYHYGPYFVEDIKEDNHSNLWVGTTKGVFIVDRKDRKLKRYTHPHPFFSDTEVQVLNILVDKQGRIWFSTRSNGLYRYNPKTRDLKQLDSDVYGFMPRPIIEDRKGNVWIGTKSHGISIYDPVSDSLSYLTMSNGLPSNFILCIQEDLNGNFWFGTHSGLSFFDISKKQFTNYSTEHGLQGDIFELGANGIFSDGYLIFGGHNGINIFNPDSIKSFINNKSDSLMFTSVKVFNKEILRDFSERKKITLKYNENYLSIEFILVNYVNPHKHKFAYRLRGVNNNWFDLGNKNYITLSSLPPGEYQLEVRGTNEYGIVSEKPLILDIKIESPIFESWLFKAVAFILIALVVLIITKERISRSRSAQQHLENEVHERTERLRNANDKLIERNVLIEKQKKEIEKHKQELEIKVKERTKDLETAKRKAEESDRLKSSFIANMSHEIRTPLNAILGFSSLISDVAQEKPELIFYQESIDSNAEILVKIIDDVLDISKIEAKQLEVKIKEVNLISLLSEVINIYKQQIYKNQKKKIELLFNNPLKENEVLIVLTDPHRLKQVLFNLIGNAIKFTNKGYIELGIKLEDPVIQFYVKDTGIGIARENFDIIFDRFIKLENKEELYRGNGLGLPLCKSLVELLGGRIWVDSLLGHGSTFYFTLPNENYTITTKKKDRTSGKKEAGELILPGKYILVVEDETSNFQYLEALLFLLGNSAIWAHNGKEAIDILTQKEGKGISLILMDIKMPRMDGFKAFARIKELGFKIPVIAITAYAQSEDKDKIIRYGFDGYIAKPVNKHELFDILRKYLK